MNESVLFKQLMGDISESVFFKDKESRFITINKACAKKFGLNDPEEAVGKTDFDFFDEAHASPAFKDEQFIMSTGKPIKDKIEKEVFKDTGKVAWTSTSKFPLYDEKGELVGTYGITKDVTIEKEIEGKLLEKSHQLTKLSEQVPGLFYVFESFADGRSCFPFASDAIEDLYEVSKEQVKDSVIPLIRRLHPQDRTRVLRSIMLSVNRLEQWDCEFRVNLPEKGIRYLHGRAMPEGKHDGGVIGYGYVMDVTKEEEVYKANTRLKEQFEAVVNSAPNLIFIKNEDGEFRMANKSAATFFGETPKTIVGKTDLDLGVPDEQRLRFEKLEREVIETGKNMIIPEDRSLDDDGNEVWHQTIKVPFNLLDSGKKGVLSIVTNITERKANEVRLQESLDIISEQNKRLNNFAHIVSHNLRNHAGNISMLLSLYDEEESEEERTELLDYMKKGADRLNETIQDLNEIIDQQYNHEVNFKEVDFAEYLDKTKEVLTTEILTHNVKIEEEIEPGLSFTYNPSYLESILLNLISNAIKYRNPDRQPVVTIKAGRANDQVFLEVRDNGLGIDLKRHGEKLFGMYSTFHGNENSKGIGLYITRNQIESMGGSIEVESEINKGTIFRIILK